MWFCSEKARQRVRRCALGEGERGGARWCEGARRCGRCAGARAERCNAPRATCAAEPDHIAKDVEVVCGPREETVEGNIGCVVYVRLAEGDDPAPAALWREPRGALDTARRGREPHLVAGGDDQPCLSVASFGIVPPLQDGELALARVEDVHRAVDSVPHARAVGSGLGAAVRIDWRHVVRAPLGVCYSVAGDEVGTGSLDQVVDVDRLRCSAVPLIVGVVDRVIAAVLALGTLLVLLVLPVRLVLLVLLIRAG